MSADRKHRTPQESLIFAQQKRVLGQLIATRQAESGISNQDMAKKLDVTVGEWKQFKLGLGGDDFLKVMAQYMKFVGMKLPEDEK